MWITHLTIGIAAIWLLVAFAFGGGFGAHTTRKRVERKEQETHARIEQIEQETRNRIERVEQEARKRIERIEQEARNRVEHAEKRMKDAEQQRDFAEQLVHDLLNETVDKKYVQAKIALLVAAKGVSQRRRRNCRSGKDRFQGATQ
jgi:TolA-binding protein